MRTRTVPTITTIIHHPLRLPQFPRIRHRLTNAPKSRSGGNGGNGNGGNGGGGGGGPTKPNKIWSTSSTEERERIKEFWLGLGEEERRNLVKIEKDTVLRKMKEQQKHSCSCAVCGRKRWVVMFFFLLAFFSWSFLRFLFLGWDLWSRHCFELESLFLMTSFAIWLFFNFFSLFFLHHDYQI
jgi:hypothetical protein